MRCHPRSGKLEWLSSPSLIAAFLFSFFLPGFVANAFSQTNPGSAHCEFVAPGGPIVCLPGVAVKGTFAGYGGTPIYDRCLVYFGNSPAVQGYCSELSRGRTVLPGAPAFPDPVAGTVFRPTSPPLTLTTDEFCDWIFSQPGGAGHYEDLPPWLRSYCETRDPSQIPPGF